MNRPRIPVIVVLGVGVLAAGTTALARQVLPPWASYSRAVDDQRNAVAKPEVRDAAEEEVEQEDASGTTAGPALDGLTPARSVESWTSLLSVADRFVPGRPHGRTRFIRGPPRRA